MFRLLGDGAIGQSCRGRRSAVSLEGIRAFCLSVSFSEQNQATNALSNAIYVLLGRRLEGR